MNYLNKLKFKWKNFIKRNFKFKKKLQKKELFSKCKKNLQLKQKN